MDTVIRTLPMILPLDFEGRIYVLEDEQGRIIGAGTRKSCEVVLRVITAKFAVPIQKAERRDPCL